MSLVTIFGVWGVAVGMALESANIPLPSEIILPFGGYLVYAGKAKFWEAVMAGTLGGLFGSTVSYLMGYKGGRPFLLRYGRYIGINSYRLQQAEDWFNRYGEMAVFLARLLPVVRTFISLPAGIAGMNFGRFLLYSLAGSLPWCIALTYIGYKLGEHWQDIEPWFRRLDLILLVLAFVLVLYWFRRRRKRC